MKRMWSRFLLCASAAVANANVVVYEETQFGFKLHNGFVRAEFSSEVSGITELSADFSGSGHFASSSNVLSEPFTLQAQSVTEGRFSKTEVCTSRNASKTVVMKFITNTPQKIAVEISNLNDCSEGCSLLVDLRFLSNVTGLFLFFRLYASGNRNLDIGDD